MVSILRFPSSSISHEVRIATTVNGVGRYAFFMGTSLSADKVGEVRIGGFVSSPMPKEVSITGGIFYSAVVCKDVVLSCATIADCMEDADIRSLFEKVETEEIAPYVHAVPEITPEAYVALIASRFSNPAIRDTTRRVAFDGSSRHTGFVLPILRDALAANASIDGLALVEALWARMCAGTREDGSEIAANDPKWQELQTAAHAAKSAPSAWLQQAEYYGDIAQDARFAERFCHWLSVIWTKGPRAALQAYARS